MTLQIKDRIRETSATTGTGTYTLAGAVAGFNPFSDISDADTTYYLAERDSQWEIGLGTVGGSGTTLARTTILRSSNADAAVNWGSGTKHVAAIVPAQLLEKLAEVGSDTFAEFVRDTVGTALTAGANITVTPDDGADTITVAVTAMTASRAVETDGSGNLTVSAVTATELGYVSGATSNLQAQIAALQALTIRQPAVIDRVDNTTAPPTEVSGDRYLLDSTGSSHANWDGAAGNSIVEYDGASWVETVPAEGWVVYVDSSDTDWLAVDDGTLSWEERTAAAISLNGLLDVVITGPSAGHVLKYNGSTWVNAALTASNIGDPENFTFTASQISDFSEAVDDRVSTLLVAGSGVSLTYDDGANTLTIDAGASVGQLADLTDVDDSLAGNKGDLLIHDGTQWTDLDAGTDGEVLHLVNGLPAWLPGATPKIAASRPTDATWIGAPSVGTVTTTGSLSLNADTLYLVPVLVTHDVTAAQIALTVFGIGTANNVRLGIYNSADGMPSTLLLDGGAGSVAASGFEAVTISQALTPGLYFLAMLLDGTCTLKSLDAAELLYHFGTTGGSPDATQNKVLLYKTGVAYGALPSTASTTDALTASIPRLSLQVTS